MILYNRNGGSRAHKENQFKNRNVETCIDDLPRILEKNQLKEVTKIATFIENKLEKLRT